ncbi:MAG TPA: DUF255 domain-containing protein [Planctomycetota bacterium]|nr:DUF255 domain-containing protein [Planctomycetota bacterium]
MGGFEYRPWAAAVLAAATLALSGGCGGADAEPRAPRAEDDSTAAVPPATALPPASAVPAATGPGHLPASAGPPPPTSDLSPALKDTSAMHKPLPTAAEIAKLPSDGGPEFNRLIFEKSPYLLQHARNPVHWYPWGPAAFAKAKLENKPIFLSVGYSTCHWCHVMERESFENEAVAHVLNDHYVAIKVDREERPDLDDIYMSATQLMTQRGGWPNSLWLTPDGTPWFAGTYFPPDDRYGRPGFTSVLLKLNEVWTKQRDKVDEQAAALKSEMQRIGSGAHVDAEGTLSRQVVTDAMGDLPSSFDKRRGGFGTAPKFTPHGSLALMLYEMALSKDQRLLDMTRQTLDAMAMGGIHDAVGGGFHRYSTDADWFLPHFEKMLYDNAQLGRAYTRAFALTGDAHYAATAEDTFDWVLREMTDKNGGFYSAIDADSEGVEGKFYLWTPAQVEAALGADDGALFCRVYNIEKEGNYHDEASGHGNGSSIAHLKRSLEVNAKAENLALDPFLEKMEELREKLLAVRNQRVHPHLDDKVLTSWNGLMIGALAEAGNTLKEPRYTAAAKTAADYLLAHHIKDGRLLRTSREGDAKLDGYLEDYAFLADGLLDLSDALGEPDGVGKYGTAARELAAMMVAHFYDSAEGGFFFTADSHEKLLLRQKDAFDQAIPSGNGMAVRVLVRLASSPTTAANPAGKNEAAGYLAKAEKTLGTFLGLMQRMPRGTECLLLATAMYYDHVRPSATGADATPADPNATALPKPDAQVAQGEVNATATISAQQAEPGAQVEITVTLAVAKGFHIYDHAEQDVPVTSTEVKLAETVPAPAPAGSPPGTKPLAVRITQPVTVTKTDYPAAREETMAGDKVKLYDGTVTVHLTCQVNSDLKPGKETIVLQVIAQPCNEKLCKEPVDLRLMVPIEVVKPAAK